MDLHNSNNIHRCVAEGIGTFWLTFVGCGSAVIAAGFPEVGIGLLGVSLAFGLAVVTMAYAIWPRLWMPPQSGSYGRPCCRRAFPDEGGAALRRRAGHRRSSRRRCSLCHGKRLARV